jgi:phage-related protein
MLNSIIDWFHTKFDELLAFIRDLIPKLIQAGTDLIAGLWQGFKDRWAQFLSDSKALIEGLPKWVKKILGIASPSKVFMDIGQQITRGLMIGMTGQQNNLRGAAQQISNVNFNVQPGFLFRSEDNFVRDMQLLNNLYGGRA